MGVDDDGLSQCVVPVCGPSASVGRTGVEKRIGETRESQSRELRHTTASNVAGARSQRMERAAMRCDAKFDGGDDGRVMNDDLI